jgi:Spy/CpxP family protein refolding chaperone
MSARTQAVVLLALVATSGALAGIVADRIITDRGAASADRRGPPGNGPWRWEARPDARYAERLTESLELTSAQGNAIDDIVAEEQVRVRQLTEEVQPRFRAIADDTRERIESVLTPEQRRRLGTLREQRMRMMREGARGSRGEGPPGWLREGAPRGAPMLEVRDSLLRERRLQWVRERDSIVRELRDSIMGERRGMITPQHLDSILRERRERMRERFEAMRDTLPPTVPDGL